MIRPLRPTDVVAYVAFRRQVVHCHESEISGGSRRLPTIAEFWGRSFAVEPGRESWIQIDRGHMSGLIAAKRRFHADVWDIDQLLVLPSPDASRTCMRLLEHLLAAAVDEGIQKVFLRVPVGNAALQCARQVGFFQYCIESAYYLAEVPTLARPPVIPYLRPRRPSDHQALFQMYSSVVPVRVRQAEAMTLQEWRWTDGWGVHAVSFPPPFRRRLRRDYVVEGAPRLNGWLQVDTDALRMTVLTNHPEFADVGALLRHGITQLEAGRHAYCAARDYQPELALALEDNGFAVVGHFALLARALAVRIPEAKLVPIRAS